MLIIAFYCRFPLVRRFYIISLIVKHFQFDENIIGQQQSIYGPTVKSDAREDLLERQRQVHI